MAGREFLLAVLESAMSRSDCGCGGNKVYRLDGIRPLPLTSSHKLMRSSYALGCADLKVCVLTDAVVRFFLDLRITFCHPFADEDHISYQYSSPPPSSRLTRYPLFLPLQLKTAGKPPSMGFSRLAPSLIARKSARDCASLQALACLWSPSGRPRSLRVNLFTEVSRRSQLIKLFLPSL